MKKLVIAAAVAASTVALNVQAQVGVSLPADPFDVTITLTPACQLSSGPADIALAYTSFGGAVSQSSNFTVRCTNTLPYTMALDAAGGTINGINYTVALSAAASAGTGANQTHSVTASIAAGEVGTCAVGSCVGSQTRTLTISY